MTTECSWGPWDRAGLAAVGHPAVCGLRLAAGTGRPGGLVSCPCPCLAGAGSVG